MCRIRLSQHGLRRARELLAQIVPLGVEFEVELDGA